jgi:dethiobiotin synthase
VVTESYFSMDADSPDLVALRLLCDEHGAALLVDEAHALGVLGSDGRGLCAEAGVCADAIVGTFGKAFGAAGAFVAGCPALVAWLWNRARPFVFSTGLSPVVAAAALDGLRRAGQEPSRRERVSQMAAKLREGLVALGAELRGFGHVVPWIVGDAVDALRLAEDLRARGVDVRAIRPPSVPPGTARLRLTVTAAHQSGDVERVLDMVGALRGRSRSQTERSRVKEEIRRQGRVIVVGGTGTSIGKTHLAEALLHAWRRSARVVGIKPIESGVVDHLVSDAQRLAAASSFHVKQCGYALSAAVSPHLAARDEAVEIHPDVAVQFVHDAREQADGVVVELAGGLFTPIADGISNADLVARLAAETVLLVAPDRLGVLHDLTATIRAASTIPLPITGIVLVAPEHPDSSTGRNADEVRRITGVPVLAVLPRGTPTELAENPALRQLVEMLSAPDNLNLTPGPSKAPSF